MAQVNVIEHETLLLSVATMHERQGVTLSAEALLEQTELLEDWVARKRADAQLAELVATGQICTCISGSELEPAEFVRARHNGTA
jgi:hypothetical protein